MVDLAEHRPGIAKSGDLSIFYRRFGRPGGRPVIIVHGLSYFSYDWIGIAGALSTDREVVAIDMRGFGQSDCSPARDYKLESMSSDVIAVLDGLGWGEAILLGHSFGGRVCLAASGWNPSRAAGLVLVDFAPDVATAGRRATAERIGLQPDVFASIDEALSYDGYHDEPPSSPRRARMEAFLRKTENGFVLLRDIAFRDSFKRVLHAGQSPPVPPFLWTMLGELAIPGLVIRGSGSNMFDTGTLSKVRACNGRLEAIELEGGHDLAGDNPTGLVSSVRDFIERNRAQLEAEQESRSDIPAYAGDALNNQ